MIRKTDFELIAIGSIFGWRIAQQSYTRVSIACRSNYEKVKLAGFHLRTNLWGDGHFKPDNVLRADPLMIPNSHDGFDYIIFANKVTDDPSSVLSGLRKHVRPNTTLVSAQNGMSSDTLLMEVFPRNTVLNTVCNIGCSQIHPGSIEQTAGINQHAFLIGSSNKLRSQSALDVARRQFLADMDPQFRSVDCLDKERWIKLVFNTAWNSVAALTDLNTHQLFDHPRAVDLVTALAREATSVGIASGVELDANLPATLVDLAKKSDAIVPSTLQDLRNGRPLELRPIFGTSTLEELTVSASAYLFLYLIGFILSQSKQVGISTPHIQMISQLLCERNLSTQSHRHRKQSTLTPPHAFLSDLDTQERTLTDVIGA